MNYEDMTEDKLRSLQQEMNAEVNVLRNKGKYSEAMKLREEVLRVQAVADIKQQERYREYDRIAAESQEASNARIDGEESRASSDSLTFGDLSEAIDEAERIVSGKG